MKSPYENLDVSAWHKRTLEIIDQHPLDPNEIYEVVHEVWSSIFNSGIGSKPFRIGQELFPRPQIMGFFLHELIPLELSFRYPSVWRREETTDEKDLVYVPDSNFSIEIKTSSSKNKIFGNRSFAQKTSISKKSKSGYYLAVNFQNFSKSVVAPEITLVRFGWLDHDDWIGQTSSSGQQARLSPDVELFKLLALPLK